MTSDRAVHGPDQRWPGDAPPLRSGDAVLAGLLILLLLLLASAATYLAGGTGTALPHAYYVPLIVAAVRFGPPGALVTAVAAGLAVGPLMPLSVGEGTSQLTANWVARLIVFVAIGQLTAYLSHHSLGDAIAGRRFRHELRRALRQRELRLAYQPMIDLSSGDIAGVEALIRWEHPTRGVIPPVHLIGEAEQHGCMTEVTAFVVREACRQVAQWRQTVLADATGFVLSVNVSAQDLEDDDLVALLSEVLADTELPGGWIHVEMTETALVHDIEAVTDRLLALRRLGIRLAIDDFGTGESSLGHLHRFPVDVLKIDRIFIERLGESTRGDAIARSVVALAEALGQTTVAEGIETPTQARLVRELGCPLGQGYLFARPLWSEDLEPLLATPDRIRATNIALTHPGPVPTVGADALSRITPPDRPA